MYAFAYLCLPGKGNSETFSILKNSHPPSIECYEAVLSWNDLKNRDLKCEEEIYIRTETHILHFIKKIFDDVLIKMT